MRTPRPLRSLALNLAAAATLAAFCLSLFVGLPRFASAGASEEDIALNMAALLRAARAVVSDNQALINNPDKGDKGFTGEAVLQEAKFTYKMKTGLDLDGVDPATPQGELLQAEMEAIVEVVDEWQGIINKPGVGYKGFLPAIFAFQVTQKFKAKKGDRAEIKLTAPSEYVRNKQNMPDEWEHGVIEGNFRSPGHPVGQHVSASEPKNGKQAFRLILPEYYNFSCLGCHGGPKGALDRTGNRKEGGTLGALGGAISVVLYQP